MLPGGTYGAALSERRGVIVSTLGITQTLAWGSTYYLPAVFADPVSGELGLARSWFFGIFSGALLLSGLLGPLAGRMIDRHGGRAILPATNLTFAAGLALLSLASGIAGLAAAWIVIGVGMGFGLYEAAFATVTGLYGHSARNAITGITLFAGFASTVGWPTSAFFIDAFGWRGACLAWAALHVLIGLPLNRLLVPKAPSPANEPLAEGAAPSAVPWTMIVLAFVFGATWFVSTAMAALCHDCLSVRRDYGGGGFCSLSGRAGTSRGAPDRIHFPAAGLPDDFGVRAAKDHHVAAPIAIAVDLLHAPLFGPCVGIMEEVDFAHCARSTPRLVRCAPSTTPPRPSRAPGAACRQSPGRWRDRGTGHGIGLSARR